MHPLFILLLTLFIIYMIEYLIKTPLIYLMNIIMMICFLNCLDFVYYLLHYNDKLILYGSLTSQHSAHHRMDLIKRGLQFYQSG